MTDCFGSEKAALLVGGRVRLRRPGNEAVSSRLSGLVLQDYIQLENTGESFDEGVCFEVRLDVVLLLRPRSQRQALRVPR